MNTGIRRRDVSAVKAALAAGEVDATALAAASTVAKQTGDPAIVALVTEAAARTPAIAPVILRLDEALLGSYQGTYQNATTGAAITVSFDGKRLMVTADGQTPLSLQPVEERRFIAENAPEVTVTFAGRGGIVERLSIARANNAVRYEREGFGDATSPAPDPRAAARTVAPPPASAAAAAVTPRGKPLPWPAFRGANAAGAADGQGAVAEWDAATGKNMLWKTPIPGLATSSPIIWGDRVIVVAAASDRGQVVSHRALRRRQAGRRICRRTAVVSTRSIARRAKCSGSARSSAARR